MDNDSGKLSPLDQIVTNIYVWIGILVAMAAYMMFYVQLPDWVQLWLDPRLILFGLVALVIAMIAAFRAIRLRLRRSPEKIELHHIQSKQEKNA